MTESFIKRVLRPNGTDGFLVLVNQERIGTVSRREDGFVAHLSLEQLEEDFFFGPDLKAVAAQMCEAAEVGLDDFFFVIEPWQEPEMDATHTVTMAMRGSGRVVESFTTNDPYGAVEAAREAQQLSLEERFQQYSLLEG